MLTACEERRQTGDAYQRPATWLKARDLIRQGAIGTVRQIQMDDGGNLLNTNSHNVGRAVLNGRAKRSGS